MNYTIIHKSAWKGDYWKLYTSMTSKDDAQFTASSIKSPRSKSSFYYVKVMRHRKPLSTLTSYDDGYGEITFNDGTKALV